MTVREIYESLHHIREIKMSTTKLFCWKVCGSVTLIDRYFARNKDNVLTQFFQAIQHFKLSKDSRFSKLSLNMQWLNILHYILVVHLQYCRHKKKWLRDIAKNFRYEKTEGTVSDIFSLSYFCLWQQSTTYWNSNFP